MRQGGVLSPLFFAIYVDDVISEINDSNLGCCVRGIHCGIWLYADDIILLSPSVSELQKWLISVINL